MIMLKDYPHIKKNMETLHLGSIYTMNKCCAGTSLTSTANTVVAESRSHPLLNASCVGMELSAAAQWLTVWAAKYENLVANDNKAARQEQHWFAYDSIRAWSRCGHVEVGARVARSSGDMYTTGPVTAVSVQWLMSAI